MNNAERQGRFTSSQMYRLLGSKRVIETYTEEKNIERKMARCLDVGTYSQSMAWGRYMELRVFKLLGMEYNVVSKETIVHRGEAYKDLWAGSPDLIAFNEDKEAFKATEVKCYYPKEFARLTDALLTKDPEHIKATRPKEYWQAVSNAVLCGVATAEIVSYMPYISEMEDIRDDVSNFEGDDLWQYRFIVERGNDVLPTLPDNGFYKNLNVFSFEVTMDDITTLGNAVLNASNLLIPRHK